MIEHARGLTFQICWLYLKDRILIRILSIFFFNLFLLGCKIEAKRQHKQTDSTFESVKYRESFQLLHQKPIVIRKPPKFPVLQQGRGNKLRAIERSYE
jgi:PBP1b-binding outer membrane lipoprotein LpoB